MPPKTQVTPAEEVPDDTTPVEVKASDLDVDQTAEEPSSRAQKVILSTAHGADTFVTYVEETEHRIESGGTSVPASVAGIIISSAAAHGVHLTQKDG